MPPKNNNFKLSTSEGCQTEGSLTIGVFPIFVKMFLNIFQGARNVNGGWPYSLSFQQDDELPLTADGSAGRIPPYLISAWAGTSLA